jgi:hypothetical protein
MSAKSFNNLIDPIDVSIAIERVLIAPYPFVFSPARVNLSSIPAGLHDLGAVVEDTPEFKVTRKKFQLDTGVPAVRQYEAVTGLTGNLQFSLHSDSWKKIAVAMGNYSAVSSATNLATISSVVDYRTVTMVTTTSSLSVGDQVILATGANGPDQIDGPETRIGSINGLTLVFDPPPLNPPVVNMNVWKYPYVRQALGTSKISQYTVLGVADFIDGVQIVHYIPKCVPEGDWMEQIRPAQNPRIPINFSCFGVPSTVYGSSTELIVAERFYFPTGS